MKNRNMIRVGMACLVACASLVLVSCDLDDVAYQPQPLSYVYLYNASPDAPDLGIVVDSRQINNYPFEYADKTGYLQFYIGNRKISFTPFGANNSIADTTVALHDANAYSLFLVDKYEDASILILNDSADAPAAGKAKIRIINLSPDAAPISLKVKDADGNIAQNLAFKKASGFIEVDADKYDFEVTGNGSPLALNDVNLVEGSFHTIVIRGYNTPPAGNTNVYSADIVTN